MGGGGGGGDNRFMNNFHQTKNSKEAGVVGDRAENHTGIELV